MDLQAINQRYGRYIWRIANRYHTGIWAAEDVFSQIALQIHSAVNAEHLDIDNNQQVKSFIITRAIDIIRHEKRRRCVSLDRIKTTPEETLDKYDPPASPSPVATQFEIELIRELLFTRLDRQIAEFIFELAFPTPTTVEIAMADQTAARVDSRLRMNVRELKVLPKHVAEYVARGGQSAPSPATISRMRAKAREAIYEEEKEED